MKKMLLPLAVLFCTSAFSQNKPSYKIVSTFHIASGGGWDYLVAHNGKLYVSHGTQVNILNQQTGYSLGVISGTTGVHGIAFDDALGRGYTSNGRLNNVTVFDLKTNKAITQIATGENPDAIMYEPFSKTIITCNGKGKNLSFIDPKTNTVIATTDVGGKPETAVSDASGKLFVNIEDKNEIAEVDVNAHTVLHHWPLAPGEGPTGLAYDKTTKRLFAGCEKLLVVMNAANGSITAQVPIGDGCDGVAFDAKNKLIFTSNGEGTLSVVKEVSADKYEIVGTYPTQRGARTIAFDAATGTIFVPTADFETAAAGERPKMIPGTFRVLAIKRQP